MVQAFWPCHDRNEGKKNQYGSNNFTMYHDRNEGKIINYNKFTWFKQFDCIPWEEWRDTRYGSDCYERNQQKAIIDLHDVFLILSYITVLWMGLFLTFSKHIKCSTFAVYCVNSKCICADVTKLAAGALTGLIIMRNSCSVIDDNHSYSVHTLS